MNLFLRQLVLQQFSVVLKQNHNKNNTTTNKQVPILPGKFPLLWASENPIQENPEIEEEIYNAETPHQLSLWSYQDKMC